MRILEGLCMVVIQSSHLFSACCAVTVCIFCILMRTNPFSAHSFSYNISLLMSGDFSFCRLINSVNVCSREDGCEMGLIVSI